MRLGTKLLLSFLCVALLVLMTGTLSYYFSNDVKNNFITESGSATNQLQALSEMTIQLQNSLLYTRNYLTEAQKQRAGDQSVSVGAQIRESERIVVESLNQFGYALDEISAEQSPLLYDEDAIWDRQQQIETLTDSLERSFSYYNTLVRELFDLDREVSLGNEVFNVTIEPYFRNTLLSTLLELRTAYNQRIELQLAYLQDRADETLWRIILTSVLAFAVALLLAYLIYTSISRPVQKLTVAAERIGRGDLSRRIDLNTNDELADLAGSFNGMAENLSNTMVSKTYVDNIIQSMAEMLVVTNEEGHVEMANRIVSEKLGYASNELEGMSFWNLIPGEERTGIRGRVNSRTDNGPAETRFVAKNGELIPVNLSWAIIQHDEEEEKAIYVAGDITSLKQAEQKISESLEEKNVLLAEIHHRVKNNLAVISGLLEMQAWNVDDKDTIKVLRDSQLRIQSIALVHEKLYKNDNFADVRIADYIRGLVQGIADSFKGSDREIRVEYRCEDIRMNINQAIPFSLLINESIVNVYKHAFKGKKNGMIEIVLKREDDQIRLVIEDNGSGLPEDMDQKTESSLGMKLIDTLTRQIEGTYELTNREDAPGTRFQVSFPDA
jgi:PAS domain S-box-containing protein